MKRFFILISWIVLFVLCAVLGFFPQPAGLGRVLCMILSVLFFLPPALLLWDCRTSKNRKLLLLIRNLALISLGLTALLLMANVLCVFAPALLGDILYGLLAVLSTPMLCSYAWGISLFLWACLLYTSMSMLKGKKASKKSRNP